MFSRKPYSIFLVCSIATMLWPSGANAETFYVHPTPGAGDYQTIADAVAHVEEGSTIRVGPGDYESFTVDKQLMIISQEGPDVTRITSGGSVTFTALADHSLISGFTISIQADDGIFVTSACDYLTIENNILSGSGGHGIYVQVTTTDLNYTTIRNNTISDNAKSGIHLQQDGAYGNSAVLTSTLVASNLVVRNGEYGIARAYNSYASFTENSFLHNNCWSNASGCTSNVTVEASDGNLFVDPLFLDADTGDYHLQASSPCIDAGRIGAQYRDPDGTRNDMGVYGGPGAADWWPDPAGGPVVTDLSVTPPSVAVGETLTLQATGRVR